MINRDIYLKKLIGFKDTQLIKIVTGIRRCGKSTLFEIFQEYLIKNEIKNEQIISLNMDDITNEKLLDYKQLYKYIENRLISNQKNYVFLDEIQNVANFQKVANSLFLKKNVDLYLTGSNAYMLSGEMA